MNMLARRSSAGCAHLCVNTLQSTSCQVYA